MHNSTILTVSIDRPYADVYKFVSVPDNFLNWASGLENLQKKGDHWITKTPQGEMILRFTPANDFGIADHTVTTPDGTNIHCPMRVIVNETGADVQFTLFRTPDMDDAKFAHDAEWVQKDLNTLKHYLETQDE